MPPLIIIKKNLQQLIEKRLRYRFHDKERERSQRAAGMADRGPTAALCPLRHRDTAWSGPPHNSVRQVTCLTCFATATEFHVKEMGYHFDDRGTGDCPDYVIEDLMDEELRQRFERGNPTVFVAHK